MPPELSIVLPAYDEEENLRLLLPRIVDCLRHLRTSRARLHAKLETPFFTGPRKSVADIVASLP